MMTREEAEKELIAMLEEAEGGPSYGQGDRQDPFHVSRLYDAATSDFPFCRERNDPTDAAAGRNCRGAGPDG